ncbi:MAG: hypothetical protein K0S08_1145 [Gammaproteobacteria bacterium]|jgi:chromosome segregation ATPase|nr:hypothetical protein [Gammaproteobacteria bacterium]
MPKLQDFNNDVQRTLAHYQSLPDKINVEKETDALSDLTQMLSTDTDPNHIYLRIKHWAYSLSNPPKGTSDTPIQTQRYLQTHLATLVDAYQPIFDAGNYVVVESRFIETQELTKLTDRTTGLLTQQESELAKERALFADYNHTLKTRTATIHALAQLNTLIEQQLKEARQQLFTQNGIIYSLETSKAELEASLREEFATKRTLSDKITQNVLAIEEKDTIIAGIENRIIKTTAEKEALQKQVDELAFLNAKLKPQIEALQVELNKERGIKAEAEVARKLAQQRAQALEEELKKYHQAYAELQQQNQELRQNVSARDTTIQNLQREMAGLNERSQKDRALIAKLEEEKDRITTQFKTMQLQLSASEETKGELKIAISSQVDKIKELEAEVERLKLGAVKMMELQGEAAKHEGATTPAGEETKPVATIVASQGIFRRQEIQQQTATTRSAEQAQGVEERKVVGLGRR